MFSVHNTFPFDETYVIWIYFEWDATRINWENNIRISRENIVSGTVIHIRLSRTTSDGEEEFKSGYFRSKPFTNFTENMVPKHIEEEFLNIHSFEEFTQRGSY